MRLGFVATVGPDGSPRVSPKGTLSVWDARHLVFADLASPGTIANLERDPRVEVNVVDQFARKGWRFRGRAHILRGGATFQRAVEFFARRDVTDAPRRIRTIVIIRVDRVLPLVSPAYALGQTEASLRKEWWAYFRRQDRRRPSRPSPGGSGQ